MSAAAKRPAYKLTAPVVPEHALQKMIADALRIEIGPPGKVSNAGVVWWSCDAADYGGSVPGIRIGRGLVAGIPDMFVLHLGRAFFIEIKTDSPTARLSDAQQSVCAALLASGGQVGIVRGVVETLSCLDCWHVPRARRIRSEV